MRFCLPLLLAALMLPAFAQDEYHVIPLNPDPPIALDGDLGDWAEIPNSISLDTEDHVKVGTGKWQGPDDLSGVIQLAWRNEGLYFAARVRDNVVAQSQRSAMMWKGDHIEVFIDTVPDIKTDRNTWGPGQYQFGLSPGNFRNTGDALTDVSPEAYGYQPEGGAIDGIIVASAKEPTGYRLEAFIPWKLIGVTARANLPVHIEAAFSDCDSEESVQDKFMTIGTERWYHGRDRLIPMLLGNAVGEAEPPARHAPIRETLSMDHDSKLDIEFDAPATPEGKDAYLHFFGRIDSPKPAGYAGTIRMSLNGTAIDGKRLKNRPQISTYRAGSTMTFMTNDGLIALPYGPDFKAVDTHPTYGLVDARRACEFELLVTDALKAGANTLHIETRQDPRGQWKFEFAEMSVVFKAPPPPESEPKPAPTGPIAYVEPRTEFAQQYAVSEIGKGSLEVEIGGEKFLVESQFSSPDSKWNSGSCSFFDHSRRFEQGADGITVFDTFTNLTDENLPLKQRHFCALKDRLKKVWLGGVSPYSQSGSVTQPANPTSFAITGKAGIGLMPLNDEFLVHVANYALDGVLGVTDNSFVLQPGKTYTAEWTIIPVASTDFWDFVNAARRIRDANFTLPYQFAFLGAQAHTDDFLKRFVAHKTPDLVCASIGYPKYNGMYAHGTAFQKVDHSYYARHSEQMKKLFPDVKTSVYFHCFLDVLEEAPELYKDARTLRPDGTQATYGREYDKIFLPTQENTFGRDIARNIDYIYDQCGADGVYWDELSYSRYQYHYGDPWDGCSGTIDPSTHKLTGLKTSVTLASLPWRVQQIERVMQRGPFIANGMPHTRTVANLKFQRFVETAAISNCLRAILYSPIALGDHIGERTEEDAYKWALKALDYGCVYNWYSESVATGYPTLMQHMFPITPMELHEGYIIGRERILTNRSGNFGWGDKSEHEVHVYDAAGKEVADFNAPLVEKDGKTYTEVRIAEGWSAAIIRK